MLLFMNSNMKMVKKDLYRDMLADIMMCVIYSDIVMVSNL